VKSSLQVLGLDVFKDTLLLWDGATAELHKLGATEATQIAQFESTARSMALHGDTVFRAVDRRVEGVTFSGGCHLPAGSGYTLLQRSDCSML
jgi:hypothetical protein